MSVPVDVPGVIAFYRGYPAYYGFVDFIDPAGDPLPVAGAVAELRVFRGDGPNEFAEPVVIYSTAADDPDTDPPTLQRLSYAADVLGTGKAGFLLALSGADTAGVEDGCCWGELSLSYPAAEEDDTPVLTMRIEFRPSGRAR